MYLSGKELKVDHLSNKLWKVADDLQEYKEGLKSPGRDQVFCCTTHKLLQERATSCAWVLRAAGLSAGLLQFRYIITVASCGIIFTIFTMLHLQNYGKVPQWILPWNAMDDIRFNRACCKGLWKPLGYIGLEKCLETPSFQ